MWRFSAREMIGVTVTGRSIGHGSRADRGRAAPGTRPAPRPPGFPTLLSRAGPELLQMVQAVISSGVRAQVVVDGRESLLGLRVASLFLQELLRLAVPV